MAYIKCIVLLAAVVMVSALPQGQYGKGFGSDEHKLMPHSFEWAVKDDYSGNDFGHKEDSDGNLVQGVYYVLLPDGRRQTVTYRADHESGFVADVQYEGEARYPEPQRSQGYN